MSNNNRQRSKDKDNVNMRQASHLKRGRQARVIAVDPFRDELTKFNSSKQERQTVEIGDTAAAMSRDNPVAYYTKFSKFAEDAATLPFSLPLGSKIDPAVYGGEEYYVPGIMQIAFVPTCGISKGPESAINRSSVRFYTYLRSNQKASALYDHQDITMMELSLDSGYMFHAMCRRAYGVVKNFTPVNRYYAASLVYAMGFDYEDLVANLQDFRGYINTLAYNLGQYAMPADITLFKRHQWMCEGYYTDSISTRAQTYVFVPSFFWKYDNTVTTGSQLVNVPWTGLHTVAQTRAIGDELLAAISNEEDFAIISGDIYNFYGGDTWKLPYTDETYVMYPAYSEVVLSQIENLKICSLYQDVTKPGTHFITQNPDVNSGAIIFNPAVRSADALTHLYMNFHHDAPTPDEVIEATRLLAVPDPKTYTEEIDAYELSAAGTEIVTGCAIIQRVTGGQITDVKMSRNVVTFDGDTKVSAPDSAEALKWMANVSQFDWAPGCWVRVVVKDSDGKVMHVNNIGHTWDIDNFQEMKNSYIEMIHTACLFSLFEVGNNGDAVVSGR